MKEVMRLRNGTSEESQDCWNGFDFDGDRYDPIHQHYHRKSAIFGEVLSLDVVSISKIDAVYDSRVHLENCLVVMKLRCHHIHAVSWPVYVPPAPEYWQQSQSQTL